MPNRPHSLRDCDEQCYSCTRCYMATGDTTCQWTCKHKDDIVKEWDIENLTEEQLMEKYGTDFTA
jgi:hypothetical protein